MHTFLRSAAVFTAFLTALTISAAAPSGAFAQAYPPAGIPGAPGAPGGGAQSGAAQGVRIDRLENRLLVLNLLATPLLVGVFGFWFYRNRKK